MTSGLTESVNLGAPDKLKGLIRGTQLLVTVPLLWQWWCLVLWTQGTMCSEQVSLAGDSVQPLSAWQGCWED